MHSVRTCRKFSNGNGNLFNKQSYVRQRTDGRILVSYIQDRNAKKGGLNAFNSTGDYFGGDRGHYVADKCIYPDAKRNQEDPERGSRDCGNTVRVGRIRSFGSFYQYQTGRILTMNSIVSAKNEYVARKGKQLESWNSEINAFEQDALKQKKEISEIFRKRIVEARARYLEGVKKLDEVKIAAGTTWEALKADTENAFGAFRYSLDQFKANF